MDSNPSPLPVPDARDLKIAEQARERVALTAQVKYLQEKFKKLEAVLASQAKAKSSKAPVFTENYSLDRNKASEKKPKKKFTGRKCSDAKRHLITDTIKIFPDGVDQAQCIRHRSQFAWRMIDGKELNKDVADSVAGDPLHTTEGRRAVIENLQSRIAELCDRRDETILTAKAAAKAKSVVEPTLSHVATFISLQRELTNNVAYLFVFIEHPEVERWRTAGVSRFQKELDLLKTNLPPATGKHARLTT